MYKYVLNSVVKIPLMFAHYFRGHTVEVSRNCITVYRCVYPVPLSSTTVSNRCLLRLDIEMCSQQQRQTAINPVIHCATGTSRDNVYQCVAECDGV